MSNEENTTAIAAEETVGTDSSKHIGLTETLLDMFNQRNNIPGFSSEEPPAKRVRVQTKTDSRANATCVVQEHHGVTRVNSEQNNKYVDTSDDDKIPDDSISIPDQDHLDTEVAKLLTDRNSPDKIDLARKISTGLQSSTELVLGQFSKGLAEDKKQGFNISPHLAVIVNDL